MTKWTLSDDDGGFKGTLLLKTTYLGTMGPFPGFLECFQIFTLRLQITMQCLMATERMKDRKLCYPAQDLTPVHMKDY